MHTPRRIIEIGPLLPLLFAAATGAGSLHSQNQPEGEHEHEWTGGIETDLTSRYVSRGVAYSKGLVNHSTLWFSSSDVNVYFRSSAFNGSEWIQGQSNEIDIGTEYEKTHGRLTWAAGVDCYLYQSAAVSGPVPDTCDVSVKLRYTVGHVSVFAQQFIDVGSYRGAFYIESGLSHERALNPRNTLEATVTLAGGNAMFHRSYTGAAHSGFHLLAATVSLSHALSRHMYMRPHFKVVATRDPPSPVRITAGIALGYRWGQ